MKYYGSILDKWGNGDVTSIAVDEAGHEAGWWVSSNPDWAKVDLPRSLPEGSEVVWVEPDDPRLPKPCGGCDLCVAMARDD